MVADDHTIFRQCLVDTLTEYNDVRVIGQGSTGKEIIKQVRINEPDVIVTDIEMPEMNGFELAANLKGDYPDIKIIFLSMYYSPYYAAQAIKDGVNACLPKECSFDALLEAIRSVYSEGYFFKHDVARYVISDVMAEKTFEQLKIQTQLNHRELEVLSLLCDGRQNQEIADVLNLSTATVDSYRQRIYKKTGISSIPLLVKYAIKNGITKIN